MTHTGRCGRCEKPTGSKYAAFCTGCRLKKVLAVNHARKGVPKAKTPYHPVLGRQLPVTTLGLTGESWWTKVQPGGMTAAALAEVPRMRTSKYGQMRGGPVIELWG